MKVWLLVLACLLSTHVAEANLGMTRGECIIRYGEPVQTAFAAAVNETWFSNHGCLIKIAFNDSGIADQVTYQSDVNADQPLVLTNEVRDKLLAANGSDWKMIKRALQETWSGDKGTKLAYWLKYQGAGSSPFTPRKERHVWMLRAGPRIEAYAGSLYHA